MEGHILGLDVSTKTIGISVFDYSGNLLLVTYIAPKIKKGFVKTEELFMKVDSFKEYMNSEIFKIFNFTKVIIEEPLLRSNNINTVSTLLKFNGMISKVIYETFKVVPNYISSYDARKYAFPCLMQVRKINSKGIQLPEKTIAKNKPVLFGDFPMNIDKKVVVWELVTHKFPLIEWHYNKKGELKGENYDMSDSIVCVLGFMGMNEIWKN